jgi:HD-GYP domain-containing protein (c-di-GMP phosphodiesterase class II)
MMMARSIDFKKELETAARNMILVKRPDTLLRMIVRTVAQKLKVTHAGILLHDREKDIYVLTASRGWTEIRIAQEFAGLDKNNPLICFFRQERAGGFFDAGALLYDEAKDILRNQLVPGSENLLDGALYQMETFNVRACIPSYFHDELLGILMLGSKKNNNSFIQDEIDFLSVLSSNVAMTIRNSQLFNELTSVLDKKQKLFIDSILALVAAIDAKDHYTYGHTTRVTGISLEIIKKISEKEKIKFDAKFLEQLHIASLLHDIGKIGIPESILNKPSTLTADERRRIEEHTLIGVNILQPIKELETAILGVKYHHEKHDGSGYPEGLSAEAIPLIAAIIAAADVFDAMTTDRPYRKAFTRAAALAELEKIKGFQLNPKVVDAFLELCREGMI